MPIDRTKNWIRERVEDPKKFAKGSFRTISSGKHKIILACPKGKYSAGKCKESLVLQSILHPLSESSNPASCSFNFPAELIIDGQKYVLHL